MPLHKLLVVLPLAMLLASCGTPGASPPASSTPASTEPTVASSAPPASPTAAATSSPAAAAALTAVAEEVGKEEYNTGLDILVPLHEADTANEEVANALADLYNRSGVAKLRKANGNATSLADAYFDFTKGLDVNPTNEQIRAELQANRNLAEALSTLAERLSALGGLITAEAPQADRQAIVDELHQLLGALMAEQPSYLTSLPPDQLLTAARVAEASGEERPFEEARPLFAQALDIVTWVTEQFGDTPAGAEAAAQVPTLQAKKDPPPTATPRPTSPPTATPRPQPTRTPEPARLRFQVTGYTDDPICISIQIRGINAAGWRFSVDGLRVSGTFDGGGNARACGLGARQEVTITVFNNAGPVPGGSGVPSRGSAIMVADWR